MRMRLLQILLLYPGIDGVMVEYSGYAGYHPVMFMGEYFDGFWCGKG